MPSIAGSKGAIKDKKALKALRKDKCAEREKERAKENNVMKKTGACPCCAGGKVEIEAYDLPPNEDTVAKIIRVDCKMCNGSGSLPAYEVCFTCCGQKKFYYKCGCAVDCPTCHGHGYVTKGTLNKDGGLLNRVHVDSVPHKQYRNRTCSDCDRRQKKAEDDFFCGFDG